MAWIEFFSAGAGAVLGISAVVWFGKNWLLARLQSSIQHEYAIDLEKWKKAEQVRLKSETVAALLAEWISFPEDQRALNKLTFEAYLWLPADILPLLTKTLTSSPTAPNARKVLWQVRRHLLEDDTLPEHEIVIFKDENERKAFAHQLRNATLIKMNGSPLGSKGTKGKPIRE